MKKKKIAIFCAGAILVLLAAGILLYSRFTHPDFLAPRMERQMARFLQASVRIEGLDFGIFSGVHIERLEIRPDTHPRNNSSPPAASFTEITVSHEMSALLRGRYVPAKIFVAHLDARFSPEIRQWLADIEIPGQRPVSIPDIPDIEVADGTVGFTVPNQAQPLEIENFRLSAWPEAGGRQVSGVSDFRIDGNPVSLGFDALLLEGRLETRVSADACRFSGLPFNRWIKQGMNTEKLVIEGGISGTACICLPSEAGAPPRISGEFSVTGFSAAHPAVPQGLKNGVASLRLTRDGIRLENGRAEALGGSIEIPSAGVNFRQGGVETAWVQAEANALQAPLVAETPIVSRLPREFQPKDLSGSINGRARLQWGVKEGWTHNGSMEIVNAAGTVPALDSHFSELDARVILDASGRLFIPRARARGFGGRVSAEGACEIVDGKLVNPDLELRLKDVLEPEALVRRLPVPVQEFIEKAGPKRPVINGLIGFQAGNTRLDLALDAESVVIPHLPERLEDFRVDLAWKSGSRRVVFENARAMAGGSPLQASGALTLGQPLGLNAAFRGRQIAFNNQVLNWLGFELKDWQAEGTADMEVRIDEWRPFADSRREFIDCLQARVDLRAASVRYAGTGKIAGHISSHIVLDKNGVTLSDTVGEIFGIAFHGGGRLPLAESSRDAFFHVVSENFVLDDAFYERFPLDIGPKNWNLGAQGVLKVELQGKGARLETYQANIRLLMHQMELAAAGKKLTASGTGIIRLGVENRRIPEIEGSLSLEGLSYGGLSADRLSADFSYGKQRLRIPEMILRAYGGKATITGTRIDTADRTWQGKAAVSHLELEALLEALNMAGPRIPSGVLDAEAGLSGRGMEMGALSGEGSVKVSRGQLYNFPLLVAVFNVLDLQLPRQSPVTDAYGEFQLNEGQLEIRDLLLTGGTVPAHFQGSVGLAAAGSLKQKPIDLLVTTARREGFLDRIPLINWAKHYTVDYLRHLIFQARVTGTVGDYAVSTLSSPVTDPIRKMFSLLKKITPSPPESN